MEQDGPQTSTGRRAFFEVEHDIECCLGLIGAAAILIERAEQDADERPAGYSGLYVTVEVIRERVLEIRRSLMHLGGVQDLNSDGE